MLLVNTPPKAELVPELAFYLCRIHAGRLNRVQDIYTDFNQLGNDGSDHSIGVIGNFELRVEGFDLRNESGHPGFKKPPPALRRDHHSALRAHIVTHPNHIHAHLHEFLGRGQMVLIRNLQDPLCDFGVEGEVRQQPFQPS